MSGILTNVHFHKGKCYVEVEGAGTCEGCSFEHDLVCPTFIKSAISGCGMMNVVYKELPSSDVNKTSVTKTVESKDKQVGLKYDQGKNRVDLIEAEFIEELGEVLSFGAEKYTDNSWQMVTEAKKRYTAALFRHWLAYMRGEEFDKESGKPHLSHITCNAMFLRHFDREDNNV